MKLDLIEESIELGHHAIFSEYYKQEKRLKSDLNVENERNNYAELIKKSCSLYIYSIHRNPSVVARAYAILRKLG